MCKVYLAQGLAHRRPPESWGLCRDGTPSTFNWFSDDADGAGLGTSL